MSAGDQLPCGRNRAPSSALVPGMRPGESWKVVAWDLGDAHRFAEGLW